MGTTGKSSLTFGVQGRIWSGTVTIINAGMAIAVMECSTALAQEFPSKPVRIVAANAGTATDFTARWIAQRLGERWSKPVVVDNRGGLPLTGADLVAKATPDGYTLLMGQVASHATPMHLYKQVPYDATKDFLPITLAAKGPSFLVAHSSLAVDNVRDLVAYVRKRPGEVRHAGTLSASATQLTQLLFNATLKLDMLNVPYKGTGAVLTAVLGAETHVAFLGGAVVLPSVNAGKLKALAVTSRARFAGAPSVPTVQETVIPNFESTAWSGVFAPAKTPSALIDRLNRDIVEVLRAPKTQAILLTQALEPASSSPSEFAKFVQDEIAKWGIVIKTAGIKPE